VEFLTQQNAAALFLDPGLGKTSITLSAFAHLHATNLARRALVVAPLRVIQTVWKQEAQKWTQFRHLRFATLHGPKKGEVLKSSLKDDAADIYLINPEGCQWLAQWLADQFCGRRLPFDTVVIDELTKFKNHKAVRSKTLRPLLRTVARRWGLTGTPVPNGYMDLFGQFLMLDDGAALGKYVTHYRDQYFTPDFNGFDYVLQPGAAARIEAKVAPYVLRMSAEDYLTLPPLVEDIRYVELDPEARRAYDRMKKEMIAELPQGTVTGANSAAVYSKLKQMANGAVYLSDDLRPTGMQNRESVNLHDAKLDAVEELVEELAGQPLLLAYEFNHDLERLLERFPGTPYLGAGVNGKRTQELVDEWNAGKHFLLLAHPASAGHGLNLQGAGAAHIAWFGPTWDLELYEQFIQRVHRQGNTAGRVVNHLIVAKGTIDELVIDALRDKATTQDKLLSALNTEILRDAEGPASGRYEATKESTVEIRKLSRQSDAQGQTGEPRRITPRGWGAAPAQPEAATPPQQTLATEQPKGVRPRGWGGLVHAQPALDDQRAAIERKITQDVNQTGQFVLEAEEPQREPTQLSARRAFSPAIQALLNGDPQGEDTAPAPAPHDTESAAPPASEPEKPKRARKAVVEQHQAPPASTGDAELRKWALERAMSLKFSDADLNVIATAQSFVDFVNGVS